MTSSAQNSRQTLTPKGSATVPGFAFQGDNNTGIYSPGANEIAVATNGTVAMSVDASQNVGLTNALPVGSGGTGFKTYTTGDILYASGSGALSKLAIGGAGTILTVSGGVPAWSAAPSSGVLSVSASSSSSGFSLSSSGTSAVSVTFQISNASTARSTLGLGSIATQDSSSVNLSGGTIGGSTTVNTTGDGKFGQVKATTGTGSGTGYVFTTGGGSFATNSNDSFLNFTTNTSIYSSGSGSTVTCALNGSTAWYINSSLFEVSSTNAAKPGGGSWIASSDVRVKKNVQDYTLSADALLTLRPVSYQYNGLYGTPDNGQTYIGLIAQEVEETPFSSMVGTYTYNGTTLLNLDSSQLVYALINAVQDLTARVKALEAKVG